MPNGNELIASPLTVWLAPAGTAFPTVDDPVTGDFTRLGAEGSRNYDEDGVTTQFTQTIETFTGAGSTAPRKAFRTEEGLVLGLTLVDFSPEQIALVLDDADVQTVAASAGVAGTKRINLLKGLNVANFAMLARGESPVTPGLIMQHEWPTVFQSAEPEPVHVKGTPAALAVEYTALEVVEGEFGDLTIQTAAPS